MEDKTKKARPLPTAEEVRALLDYDPATGLFRWRRAVAQRVRVGAIAGSRNVGGYTYIGIDGRRYLAHRLALLYVTGAWPAAGVDHRDGDPGNNRLANLREATQAANLQNLAKQSRPTSSRYIGVSWENSRRRWRAEIQHEGKPWRLGRFATEELAYAAYLAAKAELHLTNPVPRESAYSHLGTT